MITGERQVEVFRPQPPGLLIPGLREAYQVAKDSYPRTIHPKRGYILACGDGRFFNPFLRDAGLAVDQALQNPENFDLDPSMIEAGVKTIKLAHRLILRKIDFETGNWPGHYFHELQTKHDNQDRLKGNINELVQDAM